MQLLEDGVVAALAAVGLVTLLFLLISALVRPPCKGTLDAVALVPCRRGEGARLEQTVRILERIRCESGAFRDIVIVDRGMDDDAREVAALLCRDGLNVSLCRRGEELPYFTEEPPCKPD